MTPSAYEIAVTIWAAAREVAPGREDLLSVEVASGLKDKGSGHAISHTRAYAAMVLGEAFPGVTNRWIGTVVGCRQYADAYVSGVDGRLKSGRLRWWDDDVAERVRDALVWAMEGGHIPNLFETTTGAVADHPPIM